MIDSVSRSNGQHADDVGGLPLRRLGAALRRQALTVAACTALVVGATALLTWRQQPVYSARATLRLDDRPVSGATEAVANLTEPYAIETELEILRSRSVAEDVVTSLALNVSVTDPRRVPRDSLLRSLTVRGDAVAGEYLLRWNDSAITLTAPDGARAEAPAPGAVEAAGLRVEPLPGAAGDVRLAVQDAGIVAERLRGALQVSRPQAGARIVAVAYEAHDPALTRDVVNAVARTYIERRNQMQKRQARATVGFLQQQLLSIGAQLREAESALEAFRRDHLVVDPAVQSTEQVHRAADVRTRRDELEYRRRALRELVTAAAQPADSGGWAALAATPALAGSAAISDVLQQLTTLATEQSRLAGWRTAEDPDVRNVRRSIDLQARRLGALAREQLAALDDQARSQDSMLAGLETALKAIPATELQYVRLRRQVDLMSGMYTLLQTRLKESEIAEAVEQANIQVVDPAALPRAPIRPRVVANLVFGLLGGLLLGLVVALGRELADTAVRSRDEIAAITDLPVLASIPRTGGLRRGRDRRPDRPATLEAPRSAMAEAYRSLRTNLAFSALPRGRAWQTLVVTSAEPQAGKSTTAVNLAITLAEQGQKVLLLEADQRRPVLHQLLGVPLVPGITDLLASGASVEGVSHRIDLPPHTSGSLDFIAGGTTVPNPAELAGAAPMRALLASLASRYDVVVLDTPPLSIVTDAAVSGTHADAVILVARVGATQRDMLRQAVDELRAIGAPLIGTVLTNVDHAEDRYGHYYGHINGGRISRDR